MSNVLDIRKYNPTSSDTFFFDNNIWMFLFCPLGNYSQKQQNIYSSFLTSALSARATIFVNSLVLSEFTNSFLRLDYEQWLRTSGFPGAKFKKDYIPSPQYKSTVSAVVSAVENILNITDRRPDDFHAIDISSICSNFTTIDFNDCYFIEFCKLNSLKLVTDDGDYKKIADPKLTVITSV